MSLSDAFWIAAAFAVICAYYIGEKIIDIDFSCFLAKNRKKAKYERLLAKHETTIAAIIHEWVQEHLKEVDE